MPSCLRIPQAPPDNTGLTPSPWRCIEVDLKVLSTDRLVENHTAADTPAGRLIGRHATLKRPCRTAEFAAKKPPMSDIDAQRTADKVRERMFVNDRASKWLGLQVLQVTPGHAVLAMTVRDEMLNGHDICHGGLIATLADSAFAFACNSYNEFTVASGFAIELLAPGHRGDVLTATCHEAG
jgi:acyl-CoA thioesterase